VKLGKFNVIVGPNNSGKSNFLEVFSFVDGLTRGADNFRKIIFEHANTPRGFSICRFDREKPVEFSFLLEIQDKTEMLVEYKLSFLCTYPNAKGDRAKYAGFISESLTVKEKGKKGKAVTLFDRNRERITVKTKQRRVEHKIERYLSSIQAITALYPKHEKLDTRFIYAVDSILYICHTEVFALEPDELRKQLDSDGNLPFDTKHKIESFDLIPVIKEIYQNKSLFAEFKDVVTQVLDFEDIVFEEVEMPKAIKNKLKDKAQNYYFLACKIAGAYSHIRAFSDGTFNVIGLLSLLLYPAESRSLICIEEPENYLHPKAIRTFISYLMDKSNEQQIIISTHSPFVLNLTSPEYLIVARVHEDGGTRFEKVKDLRELKRRLGKGYINFGDLLETEFEEDEGVKI